MSNFSLIFFLDGVGLGGPDPEINPFVTASLPYLNALFGPHWYLNNREPITTQRATLVQTDAGLGVPGRPQSATGQAVILSGRNVPQAIGEHYGPKPNQAVRDEINKGTLFQNVVNSGRSAALLSPYPQGYFDGINSGKRLYSSVPYAAVQAGLSLMTAADLRAGQAISPGFTGEAWSSYLGYKDIPHYTPQAAGRKIAEIARHHAFSFFEHWPSDRLGHRGTLAEAKTHLELLDQVIGGLIDGWQQNEPEGLLIITSDHGNIEDKSRRTHTENPVPTIVVGQNHGAIAADIHTLLDIAPAVRKWLGLH